MSAFNVTDQHIRYLVAAANRWNDHFDRAIDLEGFKGQAVMLRNANIQSMNHRYEDENEPLVSDFPISIRDVITMRTDPMQALKAIHCMDYQCCEPDDWETSPAAIWLRSLEGDIIRKLAGYEEAQWEIPDPIAAH